ncbi:MAG: hypothetical protein GY910_27395 [bacterium]|nr:hypothetical protein [Deltaproteobacteria bacterium]MCP4908717.1 hypothetical protein [bacterium]
MEPKYNFDSEHIDWTHIQDPEAWYPCDYKMAILHADPELGRLDLIVKWPPNSYCHFHRHVADTTVLVLEGEQHLTDILPDGSEGPKKVRTAGTYASSPPGNAHMEHGGPEGATVFFALHAADGKLFEMLDKDMNILATSTVEEMAQNVT